MSDSTSPGAGLATGERLHYLGGRNVSYDLTASDSRFLVDQERLVVFQQNQIHTFNIPVYLNDGNGNTLITIKKLGDNNLETDLRYGIDWVEVGVDSEAMAKAYLVDKDQMNPFNKTLIRQIQFINFSERFTVRIISHRFYQDLYDMHAFNGDGPDYSPSLGKYLLDKVQDLEAILIANLTNSFAVSDTANDMLDEDLTGVNPKNYVQDERHTVETSNGIDTLMPARGSFYAHEFRMWKYKVRTGTVQMSNKRYNLENKAIFIYDETSNIGFTTAKVTTQRRVYLTNENYDDYVGMSGSFIDRAKMNLMVPDVDYVFENLNTAKTEKSESEYGVYDTVRLLKDYNGEVMVTYHAYGGAVVFKDVQDMRQDIINTMRILTSKNLVTSDIFDKQPIITEILNRLQIIDQYHGHYNQVEHVVYMGDRGFHWFNIATLFDAMWIQDLSSTDEIGTFRVQSLNRGWVYEFALSVDIKQKIFNMLRCKTLATNDFGASDLKDYVAYLNKHDDVAIRLCWIGDGTKSGIMLQLGWNFDNYPDHVNGVDTDTIVVTDKSGITSKWKLIYNPLDESFEGRKSDKVYNHVKYTAPNHTTYQAGVDYYKFEETYTYFRTPSERVKEGVEYFTIDRNALAETDSYVPIQMTKNYLIADYVSGSLSAYYPVSQEQKGCPNGVYERILFKRIPKLIQPTEYTIGDTIADINSVFVPNTYDPTANGYVYSEDFRFDLPGDPEHPWIENSSGHYQLRRVLEPSDGLLAWFGNIKLDYFAAYHEREPVKDLILTSSLSKYTQPILDIMTIKGMSFKLYDRKFDRIITRSADVGYSGADYAEATGDALAGVNYYERAGEGTLESPIRWYRSTVATGEQLVQGKYYVLKNSDAIIGQVIFDLLDLCGAEIRVTKNESTGLIEFKLKPYLGTDSVINRRFDLRQIDLHF